MSKISENMHFAIIWAIILFCVKIANCDGIEPTPKELCPCLSRTICPRAYGMSPIVSDDKIDLYLFIVFILIFLLSIQLL